MKNIDSLKSDQSNFAQSKAPLQKVGAFIREARQGRGMSLEDLAASLRIGKEQLIALEEGQENLLPEKVFVKAMVRRIAEKLCIETSFILDELNGRNAKANNIYEVASRENTPNKPSISTPIMIIISGVLGIMTSILAINYMRNNIDAPPEVVEPISQYMP